MYSPLHKSVHLERKNFLLSIVAFILIFLVPSDHVVDKMCVSHGNEIRKYVMNLILLILDSYNPVKDQSFTQQS